MESDVGHARRQAQRLAERLGWAEEDSGRLALVVTEAGTNLFLHGGGGEILMRVCSPDTAGIEILALDQGPGMASVGRCMEDGFSTGGSRGVGMGSMRRLASAFAVFSLPGQGTAIMAQVAPAGTQAAQAQADLGVVCVAQKGEMVVGDAWAVAHQKGRSVMTVLDGLGHGPLAAQASQCGIHALGATADLPPQTILGKMHAAMHGTRGAAAAVVDVEWNTGAVHFAGVGNISGALCDTTSGRRHGCVSYNGIVGEGAPYLREFEYTLPRGALLVLASDGLSSRWELEPYPGLGACHPALIAGVLYRDFSRHRDDATVAVLRECLAPGAV